MMFMLQMGSLMDRVASHIDQPHYINDIEGMLQLTNMRSEIVDRTQCVIESANEFRETFDKYVFPQISLYLTSALFFMHICLTG